MDKEKLESVMKDFGEVEQKLEGILKDTVLGNPELEEMHSCIVLRLSTLKLQVRLDYFKKNN